MPLPKTSPRLAVHVDPPPPFRNAPALGESGPKPHRLAGAFEELLAKYGPQHWWPARKRYEIVVGAILTQNTAWKNVELSIENLRKAGLLSARNLAESDSRRLQRFISHSGFYRAKARCLKEISTEMAGWKSMNEYFARPMDEVREELLSIKGIGRETADCILLYAGGHLIFPIDAYTVRFCRSKGLRVRDKDSDYERLRKLFEKILPTDIVSYKEMHALLVAWGKEDSKNQKTPKPPRD